MKRRDFTQDEEEKVVEEPLESKPEQGKFDPTTLSGVYSIEEAQLICSLYNISVSFQSHDAWTLNYDDDGNRTENSRKIIPLNPTTYDKKINVANGTYGFIIPVLYNVDEEKDLWTFCAMKISLVPIPAMQELMNTISFSNLMHNQQSFPSLRVLDGFSVLNPSVCGHCKSTHDSEGGYNCDLFTIARTANINSKLPPPSWWLYWYSLIIFTSKPERSRTFQNSFFSKVIDDTPEEVQWNDVSVHLEEDGHWYHLSTSNQEKIICSHENIDNFVNFSVSYDVFKTIKSSRYSTSKKITLLFPSHANSEKLEESIWKYMEHSFAANYQKQPSSSRSRNNTISDVIVLSKISFIVPPACMIQSFMFMELGDNLLTQVANANDGFKRFYADNIKGTNLDQKQHKNDSSFTAKIQKSVLRDKYLAYVPTEHRIIKSMTGYTIRNPFKAVSEGNLSANVFRFSSLAGSGSNSKKTALDFFKKKGTKKSNYKISYLVVINNKSLNELLVSRDENYSSRKDSSLMLFWDILRLKCIEHFSISIANTYKPKTSGSNSSKAELMPLSMKLETDVNKFVILLDRFNYESLQMAKAVIATNKSASPYLLYFSFDDMCHWYEENTFIRHIDFSSNGDSNDISSSGIYRTGYSSSSTSANNSASNSANNSPASQSGLRVSSSAPSSLSRFASRTSNISQYIETVKLARNIFLRIMLWIHTQGLRALHGQKIVHADLHKDNIIIFTAPSIFRTDFTRYTSEEHASLTSYKRTYIVPLGGIDNTGFQIDANTCVNYIQEITVDSNIFPEFVFIDLYSAQRSNIDMSQSSLSTPERYSPHVPIWCFEHNKNTQTLPRAVDYAKYRINGCNTSPNISEEQKNEENIRHGCAEIFGVYHSQPSTAYVCRASEQISVQTTTSPNVTAYKNQLITNMSDMYSLGIVYANMICGYFYRNSPRKWRLSKKMPAIQSEAQSFQSMSQMTNAKSSYVSLYGVVVSARRPDKNNDRYATQKLHVEYDLQDAYLGSDWIKLVVDHDTHDPTVKDIENGNIYLNNNLGPAKSELIYHVDKLEALVTFMKKECVVKGDKWVLFDFSSCSSHDLASHDNTDFSKKFSKVAKALLLDVDALGLPLDIHNTLVQIITTEYGNLKKTHTYEYDEQRNLHAKNGSVFYKSTTRGVNGSMERKELIEFYTKANTNLLAAEKQMLSTPCNRTLDKALYYLASTIISNARSLILEEKIARFEGQDKLHTSRLRGISVNGIDALLSRIKRRGWYRDVIRTTLVHQFSFGDVDAEQICELITACLSYRPGDRPSTLEFSHALLFRDLKNYSMKSENIISSNTTQSHLESAQPIEMFLGIVSNRQFNNHCFCSDFVSDHFIADVEKSLYLLCKSRHPSGIIDIGNLSDSFESLSGIYLKHLAWFIAQINADKFRAMHQKDFPGLFINNNTSTTPFNCDKLPMLTKTQMKTFFELNVLSGQLSCYSFAPLYIPYLKKSFDMFVSQELENGKMLLFFCENFDIHTNQKAIKKKQIAYVDFFWQKVKNIYRGRTLPEEQNAKFCEDYPFLLMGQ